MLSGGCPAVAECPRRLIRDNAVKFSSRAPEAVYRCQQLPRRDIYFLRHDRLGLPDSAAVGAGKVVVDGQGGRARHVGPVPLHLEVTVGARRSLQALDRASQSVDHNFLLSFSSERGSPYHSREIELVHKEWAEPLDRQSPALQVAAEAPFKRGAPTAANLSSALFQIKQTRALQRAIVRDQWLGRGR